MIRTVRIVRVLNLITNISKATTTILIIIATTLLAKTTTTKASKQCNL